MSSITRNVILEASFHVIKPAHEMVEPFHSISNQEEIIEEQTLAHKGRNIENRAWSSICITLNMQRS